MVTTRWPAFNSATARCIAMVVFPEPPFSFPTTMTCGEPGDRAGAHNIRASCITFDAEVVSLPDTAFLVACRVGPLVGPNEARLILFQECGNVRRGNVRCAMRTAAAR